MINSYSNRLSSLFSRGIITGGLYGLFSPILYVVLMFFVMFVLPWLTPAESNFDRNFAVSNFIFAVVFWGIPSVIPSTFIGIVDGAIVATVLALKNKPSNLYAGLIGFILSMILVLFLNYLMWRSIPVNRSDFVVFWKFIFPSGMDLPHFTTGRNLFFIHSLIAIFLSTFGAWQINKKVLREHRCSR